MARFRVTIRYGVPRQRYEMLDIEADGVTDALRQLAESLSPDIEATADLVELRRQTAPDDRAYTPG